MFKKLYSVTYVALGVHPAHPPLRLALLANF
jgi:hypothetical protein